MRSRCFNLLLAMTALVFSACRQQDVVIVIEAVPNTSITIESEIGLEVQLEKSDSTIVEKHISRP